MFTLNEPSTARLCPIGGWSTFFTDLNQIGFKTICINGYFSYKISRWSQSLLKDAQRIDVSSSDWSRITLSAEDVSLSIVEDITKALSSSGSAKDNKFIWNLANYDHYVHRFGYTSNLITALKSVDNFFRDLANEGHLVIAFSDHGQVPQKHSQFMESWDELHNTSVCVREAGGAGRVRWSYPRLGQEAHLQQALQELLGENAAVIRRSDLWRLGLLRENAHLNQNLGEIITLAITDDFPVAAHKPEIIYEHGSILPAEVLVPLMVYHPR